LDGFPSWLLFPVFFLALWAGVHTLISWLGGWAALARSYLLTTEFDGRRWRFRSVVVCHAANPLRHASYASCVTLGSNVRGLYRAVFPLFRIGHPPLFIPWADVRISKHEGMLFSYLEFRFVRVEDVRLRLRPGLGGEVAAAGGLAAPA
jgi:hypothetical protein